MKQLLTAVALAAMLALLLATVATAADGRPYVDAPRMVQVGDIFTITLHCNCDSPEDTVWWPQVDQFEYLSGYTTDGRITEFDSNGVTSMQIRAIRPGRVDMWISWLTWDGEHLWTNVGLLRMSVSDEVYLPMIAAPPASFEIPQ